MSVFVKNPLFNLNALFMTLLQTEDLAVRKKNTYDSLYYLNKILKISEKGKDIYQK